MRAASHTFVVPVRLRRSNPGGPLKKITLQLSESVIAQVKRVVESGGTSSASVFVEEAVREKIRERRRAKVYAAYEEAAADPGYLDELSADMAAFDPTLADAGRSWMPRSADPKNPNDEIPHGTLDAYLRDVFLVAINEGFAKLRRSKNGWQEALEERRAWEISNSDDPEE